MIVESGQGLENADSFATVSEISQILSERFSDTSLSSWTAMTLLDKERAIIRATSYINNRIEILLTGERVNQRQALCFPRFGCTRNEFLIDSNFVPKEVKITTALIAFASTGSADLTGSAELLKPNGERIKSTSSSIGPISKSVTYFTGSERTNPSVRYEEAWSFLKPFCLASNRVIRR